MHHNEISKIANPYRKTDLSVFVCGETQEEAFARIDYLHHHGAGWCVVSGSHGSGKSMLLRELARRANRRGELCRELNLGDFNPANWLSLVADAWFLPTDATTTAVELRRKLEDELAGYAAINRPAWILVDDVDPFSPEFQRGCRWLVAAAAKRGLSLTVVLAGGDESDRSLLDSIADLQLELWPWEESDCHRYVTQSLQHTGTKLSFSREAISALHDRSGGIPGQLAKLCEWTWLAAHAEAIGQVDSDLILAVADELSPSKSPRSTYDHSAAYGAW